jgi:hypothetical protein
MQMKNLLIVTCLFFASSAVAADCVTNLRGRTICSNGQNAVAVNPHTATVTTAQKYSNGATSAQNSNGTKAFYNPNTGTAAVAQKNQNGVTTTQTNWGGEAKTKNGMGVVQGPQGTTCAKGKNNQGCKKQ